MNTIGILNDLIPQYSDWLKNIKNYDKRTISSRISNIRKIAESYNIFKEFSIDECQSITSELQYSRRDIEPITSIEINGDYYNGLSTYRQALKLFVEFLRHIGYVTPAQANKASAVFIGSFEEFKKYVGAKCRNEVNSFCKKERESHNGICEYCQSKAVLQSAHVKERPAIILDILKKYYRKAPDHYEVNLDEFFEKFKSAHMPIHQHIFFLCHKCHNALDKKGTITIDDINNKRNAKNNSKP